MARTEVKHEFIGLAALNSFIINTSAPRAVMDFSHFSARVPLISPDEKLIKAGIEYELGKYLNDVRVEHSCVVKGIVPRYKEFGFDPPSTTLFVEYEKDDTLFIDLIEVPSYRINHSFFGYQLHPTEDLTTTSFGSVLEEGTLLAKTASYGREGSMNYGLSANVAFMSHESVYDDGYGVSESFAKRASSTSIMKKVININKSTIPINLNGDDNIFRFLPEIGSKVRPDGLLCALRERNDWFSISDMSNESLNEVDVIFDTMKTYVNTNSTVIDIMVTKGNSKPEFSPKMTEQLDRYASMLINYYSRMVAKFEQIMAEKKVMYGGTANVRLTPRTHRFMTDSYVKINAEKNRKNTISHRKLALDQYRIEVTVMSVVTPTYGHKLTDVHAHKGTICALIPDHEMPVDKNGVRADVITDSSTTISRMNIGRAYEAYLGAVSRDNKERLKTQVSERFGPASLTHPCEASLVYAKDFLYNLYKLINPEMAEFIESLNTEELRSHALEVYHLEMYLYYPPDNSINITDVVQAIEDSIYKPLHDKVTYVNRQGQTVETNETIQIGKLYIMFLEKIANLHSAVSSSQVNNFGFPVKGAPVDKYKHPHSLSPTKFLAETENRILTSFIGPAAVADMMDLALNPTSHKTLYKNILSSKDGYNSTTDLDREKIPYGETESLQILNHMFTATGFVMKYEKDDT